MRAAYDICQPFGEIGKEESALAQCFMAIAGFVRKMNGTDTEVDTDIMNRVWRRWLKKHLGTMHLKAFWRMENPRIFSALNIMRSCLM